jgi:hypothetical protein
VNGVFVFQTLLKLSVKECNPLHVGPGAARVVALVTDGRVDAYQGQEAGA